MPSFSYIRTLRPKTESTKIQKPTNQYSAWKPSASKEAAMMKIWQEIVNKQSEN